MQIVQRLDSGPFKVGSRARVVQPKLRPSVWQVTDLDADRHCTWVTRPAVLSMQAGHAVEPVDAGCKLTLSFHMAGLLSPIVGRLYRPLITEYLNTEAWGLKKRSEEA